MSTPLFVTGMLRSGTSLTQVLLTNHPQALVAYQPFHQFYVDVKQLFLDDTGQDTFPPLDDGAPGDPGKHQAFFDWLATREFTASETSRLASRAVIGKGGSMAPAANAITLQPGGFPTLWASLHASMVDYIDGQTAVDGQTIASAGATPRAVVGSKEILCEEYIATLLAQGVRCVIVIRDPRAVVASANHGRYRDSVGDRYPILMLVRLWRKSAACWLQFRTHPLACTIRYEDLVADPDTVMADIARWLGIEPFPERLADRPLHDHFGQPWHGNSSFGDKSTIDAGSTSSWQGLLGEKQTRFIDACTRRELEDIGYRSCEGISTHDIVDFSEDVAQVRSAYLARHALDPATLEMEARRLSGTLSAKPLCGDNGDIVQHVHLPTGTMDR